MMHSRLPVKRLFSGLVGLPPEQGETSAPATVNVSLVSPTPAAKLGRPAKYTSNAERQAAYRDRKQSKQDDAERRTIVANILKLYRSRQPRIIALSNSREAIKAAEEKREQTFAWLRAQHAKLMGLPLTELQTALTVLKKSDQKGRLENESSGSYGQSEIERIDAKQEQSADGTRRVAPQGAPPDSDIDVKQNPRFSPGYLNWLRQRGADIEDMVSRTFVGGECRICRISKNIHVPLQNKSEATEHCWCEYEKGRELYEQYQRAFELEKDFKQRGDPLMLKLVKERTQNARNAYLECLHLTMIWAYDRARKHAVDEPPEGIL